MKNKPKVIKVTSDGAYDYVVFSTTDDAWKAAKHPDYKDWYIVCYNGFENALCRDILMTAA